MKRKTQEELSKCLLEHAGNPKIKDSARAAYRCGSCGRCGWNVDEDRRRRDEAAEKRKEIEIERHRERNLQSIQVGDKQGKREGKKTIKLSAMSSGSGH